MRLPLRFRFTAADFGAVQLTDKPMLHGAKAYLSTYDAERMADAANEVLEAKWKQFLQGLQVVYSDQKGENWDQWTKDYDDGDTHKGFILSVEELARSRSFTLGPDELKMLDRHLFIIEQADPRPDLSCHKHIVALDVIAEEAAKARALLKDNK